MRRGEGVAMKREGRREGGERQWGEREGRGERTREEMRRGEGVAMKRKGGREAVGREGGKGGENQRRDEKGRGSCMKRKELITPYAHAIIRLVGEVVTIRSSHSSSESTGLAREREREMV